ncbi:MAG: permease [Methanomicrobiaceae archaeon]|nr:permease [Methanomicrobiaceae archaeon]MDD5419115.1 permease [Methanomicrobiaceae archaeon]
MIGINDFVTAGQYFLIITAELLLLFIGISFLVGLIQEYIPPEKIRRTLTAQRPVTGTAMGAVFGALTPFCSCSTIPILLGLIRAGAPFGACMAYLFASPLLNPVIVFLVLALFGPALTLVYSIMAFGIAILSGLALERRGYLRFVRAFVRGEGSNAATPAAGCCSCACETASAAPTGHGTRMRSAVRFASDLFRQVVPYLVLGAAIGAFIYGFVPEDLIVGLAGPENPLAIPVAAVIGIPMYIRAETIIPISGVLAAKGMGIGAIMALIIGGAGASVPEVTLLASFFERRLLAAFIVTVLGVAVLTGLVFQLLQTAGMIV